MFNSNFITQVLIFCTFIFLNGCEEFKSDSSFTEIRINCRRTIGLSLEAIINTQIEFNDLVYLPANCSQTPMDFSRQTLLGFGVRFIGCLTPAYLVNVKTFDDRKETIFHVTALEENEKTDCNYHIFKEIWVLLPKIPSDYKVTFVSTSMKLDDFNIR